MKKSRLERGFIPLVLIVVLGVSLLAGGGVYYAKKNQMPMHMMDEHMDMNMEMGMDHEAGMEGMMETGEEMSDSGVSVSSSIRGLLSYGKDAVCTFNNDNAGVSTSGTIYISGKMMRGDFMTTGKTSMESHMVRNGDMVYVWQGSQGAKMNIDEMSKAKGNAEVKGSMDIDAKGNYSCKDWSADESKFKLPTAVSFIDISAMMKGMVDMKLPLK